MCKFPFVYVDLPISSASGSQQSRLPQDRLLSTEKRSAIDR